MRSGSPGPPVTSSRTGRLYRAGIPIMANLSPNSSISRMESVMDERPHALQAFLDCLRDELETVRAGKPARRCIERVFGALERPRPSERKETARLPACAYLGEALENIRGAGAPLSDMA